MPSDQLTVSLDTLTPQRLPRRRRRANPYLWTIFFKIDGTSVRLSPQFELWGQADFHVTTGSHGNLTQETVEAEQPIPVPSEIGQWQAELAPIDVPFFSYQMPGIIGVVAVLMEEKNVSNEGAEAGHQALNRYVENAVNEAIKEFDVKHIDVEDIQPSLKRYFARQVSTLADGIEAEVRDAIVETQSIWQNLWTLINQDELIGYCVWDLLDTEIPPEGESLPLIQHWSHEQLGDWELSGRVRRGESDRT